MASIPRGNEPKYRLKEDGTWERSTKVYRYGVLIYRPVEESVVESEWGAKRVKSEKTKAKRKAKANHGGGDQQPNGSTNNSGVGQSNGEASSPSTSSMTAAAAATNNVGGYSDGPAQKIGKIAAAAIDAIITDHKKVTPTSKIEVRKAVGGQSTSQRMMTRAQTKQVGVKSADEEGQK